MKIQHKRSNQLADGKAKAPTSEFMEYGELAVNFNETDPAIFIKDSDDNIVRIAGAGSEAGGIPGGPDKPTDGNEEGDLWYDTNLNIVFYWNGSNWVQLSQNTVISDNPPGQPIDGQLWWNTNDNILYIYYDDGDTQQWVITVPQTSFSQQDADGLYLPLTGGNLSGDLTLGTDKITLDATDGSAEFAGTIQQKPISGDAVFEQFTPDGKLGIYLYSTGVGSGKLNVYKNGLKGVELDRESIYLLDTADDANYPNNRNITLNGSDGSASFAGTILGENNLIIKPLNAGSGIFLRDRTTSADTIRLLAGGSAEFAGEVTVGGKLFVDDSVNSTGSVTALLYFRDKSDVVEGYVGFGGSSDLRFASKDRIAVICGGTSSGFETASFEADGSFKIGPPVPGTKKISLNANGSVTFAANKAGFTAEGHLWCTTRRGDTVMLDVTSNGLASWVPYTPPNRLTELQDRWAEKDGILPVPHDSSQDEPETPQ